MSGCRTSNSAYGSTAGDVKPRNGGGHSDASNLGVSGVRNECANSYLKCDNVAEVSRGAWSSPGYRLQEFESLSLKE